MCVYLVLLSKTVRCVCVILFVLVVLLPQWRKFSLEMFVHFERSIVAAVLVVDLVIRVHDEIGILIADVVVVVAVVVMTVHGVAGDVVVIEIVLVQIVAHDAV